MTTKTERLRDLWERRAAAATDEELAFFQLHFRRRSQVRYEGDQPYENMQIVNAEIYRRDNPTGITNRVFDLRAMDPAKFDIQFSEVAAKFYERVD